MPTTFSFSLSDVVLGAAASAAVALAAFRARMLTLSGAISATAVGTCAVAAGWGVAALLIAFFGSSALLGRVGGHAKTARATRGVAKAGARDAAQVWANGGVFAAGALAMSVAPGPVVAAAALGALAAATADTWATELGMATSHTPRSVRTGRAVEAGTSGGVTLLGTAAAIAGAAFIAVGAAVLGYDARVSFAIFAGGVAGSCVDSLAGAWLQEERWCASCGATTELTVHTCGITTRHARGLAWFDNDAVNVIATFSGALLAAAVADGAAP